MTRLAWGLGGVVAAALLLPLAGSAQQEQECRCEPRVFLRGGGELPMATHWSFSFPNARIGVSLGGDEQAEHADVGAYVNDVEEDSPADRAGLREGDVIVAVDGHRLLEPLASELERHFDEDGMVPVQRLMALAREWEAGDEVGITYLRDGQETTVTMEAEESRWNIDVGRLGETMSRIGPRLERQMGPLRGQLRELLPGDGERIVWQGNPGTFVFGSGAVSGLELRTLNPDMGRYFGTAEGILVMDVDEDSTLGLQAGDVILTVGDRDVEDPSDVRRILGSYEDGETVRFQVMRDGQRVTAEGVVEY